MPTAWGGADPVQQADANDYELGCEYLINSDLTITHLRVWTGAGEVNVTGRKGRIWSTTGGQLAQVTLADDLPTGWSQYALDTPLERLAGTRIVVSWSTGGNYGAGVNALDAGVNSADNAVTAVAFNNSANGNGIFNVNPGSFPAQASGNHAFYGIDFVYTLGIGGNTAPRITQATVTPAGATATAVIVAVDDETLVGAVYRYEWGDGNTTTSAASTATHTYAASAVYGVLLSVTDAGGLADFAAVAVEITVPSAAVTPLALLGILDAVISHALASGRFERVNGHEPKAAPGNGLTAAVWVDDIRPVPAGSGLGLTSIRLGLHVRIYTSATAEPADAIDPAVTAAVDALMAAYSGDFTFGGQVRQVDLLGAAGDPLMARAGYLTQDDRLYRVMTITVPLICNDVWEQTP